MIPDCLTKSAEFPHKADVLAALNNGATLRRDERSLPADRLLGTYQIRLRIAQEIAPRESEAQLQAQAALDMAFLVSQLRQQQTALVTIWYVRATDNSKFVLMENAQTSEALGCLANVV
jgi:hypothetical protein